MRSTSIYFTCGKFAGELARECLVQANSVGRGIKPLLHQKTKRQKLSLKQKSVLTWHINMTFYMQISSQYAQYKVNMNNCVSAKSWTWVVERASKNNLFRVLQNSQWWYSICILKNLVLMLIGTMKTIPTINALSILANDVWQVFRILTVSVTAEILPLRWTQF